MTEASKQAGFTGLIVAWLALVTGKGPLSSTRFLWNRWLQLTLDALLFGLWVVAAVADIPHCSDLCKACSTARWVRLEDLYCQCTAPTSSTTKRMLQPRQFEIGQCTD